jgi:hypothetical protein
MVRGWNHQDLAARRAARQRTKTSADEVAVFETQRHFCRKNSDGPAIHPKPRFWLGVNLAETGRAADSE